MFGKGQGIVLDSTAKTYWFLHVLYSTSIMLNLWDEGSNKGWLLKCIFVLNTIQWHGNIFYVVFWKLEIS